MASFMRWTPKAAECNKRLMAIYSYTFSPTGTSAKILKGILAGIIDNIDVESVYSDLTKSGIDRKSFSSDDLMIVSAPVYGGKIAPLVKQRLEGISGDGTKCIVVAVYGNRAFEKAVNDLAGWLTERGFIVCGAAAFIGEHSYSTDTTPIAKGRPTQQDLSEVRAFGTAIAARLHDGTLREIDTTHLEDEESPAESLKNFRNFVMEYQRQQTESPKRYLPEIDATRCDQCGVCTDVCPTGAISPDTLEVDPSKCIKCCACVKCCPNSARTLFTTFALPLSQNFSTPKSPRWLI